MKEGMPVRQPSPDNELRLPNLEEIGIDPNRETKQVHLRDVDDMKDEFNIPGLGEQKSRDVKSLEQGLQKQWDAVFKAVLRENTIIFPHAYSVEKFLIQNKDSIIREAVKSSSSLNDIMQTFLHDYKEHLLDVSAENLRTPASINLLQQWDELVDNFAHKFVDEKCQDEGMESRAAIVKRIRQFFEDDKMRLIPVIAGEVAGIIQTIRQAEKRDRGIQKIVDGYLLELTKRLPYNNIANMDQLIRRIGTATGAGPMTTEKFYAPIKSKGGNMEATL